MIRAALGNKSSSSVADASSDPRVFGRSALHSDGFRRSSTPSGLIGSSLREPVIVSALDCRALRLEIGDTLNLELLRMLQLELRGREWLCPERAR